MRQNAAPPAVAQLRTEMDRLFDRFFRNPWMDFEGPSWFSSAWLPSVDVSDSEKEVKVNLDLPGVDPKEIDLSLSGSTLTIQGEKKEETEDKNSNYYSMERR